MRPLRISEVVPVGFAVEEVDVAAERVTVTIRASASSVLVSALRRCSCRVHSLYHAPAGDLPVSSHSAELILRAGAEVFLQ